jgi:hypothetical protein
MQEAKGCCWWAYIAREWLRGIKHVLQSIEWGRSRKAVVQWRGAGVWLLEVVSWISRWG